MREVDFYMSETPEKRFEFLEHVSDAYVAAYGRSLEEAFENAALAMFDTMADTSTIELKMTDSFQVKAHDEYALLYSWLETLLLKFETEMKLYSKFNVASIKRYKGTLVLSAKASGETYSPQKHRPKIEVKAVTYHKMEIVTKPNSVVVRFILDL
jgi:SHS2 domain-containing protein